MELTNARAGLLVGADPCQDTRRIPAHSFPHYWLILIRQIPLKASTCADHARSIWWCRTSCPESLRNKWHFTLDAPASRNGLWCVDWQQQRHRVQHEAHLSGSQIGCRILEFHMGRYGQVRLTCHDIKDQATFCVRYDILHRVLSRLSSDV